MEGVNSGCSGALKPGKLGLSFKANKCSDAGTGDPGVLTTHEKSPCFSLDEAGSSEVKVSRMTYCFAWLNG